MEVIKFLLITDGTSAAAKALPVGLEALIDPNDEEDSGVDNLKGILISPGL